MQIEPKKKKKMACTSRNTETEKTILISGTKIVNSLNTTHFVVNSFLIIFQYKVCIKTIKTIK